MSENPTLSHSLRQLVPTVILAILTAVITTWLAIRDAQQESRFKQDVMSEAIKKLSEVQTQLATAQQQQALEQAKQAKDIENLKERGR